MSLSNKINTDFLQRVIGYHVVDDALDWVRSEMDPKDVFEDDQIEKLVMSEINSCSPGDAIHDALTSWAEANNYVKSRVPADERDFG